MKEAYYKGKRNDSTLAVDSDDKIEQPVLSRIALIPAKKPFGKKRPCRCILSIRDVKLYAILHLSDRSVCLEWISDSTDLDLYPSGDPRR